MTGGPQRKRSGWGPHPRGHAPVGRCPDGRSEGVGPHCVQLGYQLTKWMKRAQQAFGGRVLVQSGGEPVVWGAGVGAAEGSWQGTVGGWAGPWARGHGCGPAHGWRSEWVGPGPHAQQLVTEPPEAFPTSAPRPETRGITLGRCPS